MGKTFWGARRWPVIVPLTALLLLVPAGSLLAATGAFSANDNPGALQRRRRRLMPRRRLISEH